MKMVKFSFFNEAMQTRTERSQLILLGNRKNPIKVWLPLSQIKVEDDDEREGYNIVTVPFWIYCRSYLPEYTEVLETFYTEDEEIYDA